MNLFFFHHFRLEEQGHVFDLTHSGGSSSLTPSSLQLENLLFTSLITSIYMGFSVALFDY
jgi:hypothetical protein